MQHLLDIEPVRKQSDHRLLFGSFWAAVWLRADEFEDWEKWEGGAMGKFGRRVVQVQVQVQLLVDVCVHNGINVGELVGAERPAEYLLDS